jgi:hypothetical protein
VVNFSLESQVAIFVATVFVALEGDFADVVVLDFECPVDIAHTATTNPFTDIEGG